MSALTRGDIVAAGGVLLLVWSHGESDITGLPLNRSLRLQLGEPVRTVQRSSCHKVGRADAQTLRTAREATQAALNRATAAQDLRATDALIQELFAERNPISPRGNVFWNGDVIEDGCFWVRHGP